jgi:hypothetical protein
MEGAASVMTTANKALDNVLARLRAKGKKDGISYLQEKTGDLRGARWTCEVWWRRSAIDRSPDDGEVTAHLRLRYDGIAKENDAIVFVEAVGGSDVSAVGGMVKDELGKTGIKAEFKDEREGKRQ